MLVPMKVGIALLGVAVGVGIPASLWLLGTRDEARVQPAISEPAGNDDPPPPAPVWPAPAEEPAAAPTAGELPVEGPVRDAPSPDVRAPLPPLPLRAPAQEPPVEPANEAPILTPARPSPIVAQRPAVIPCGSVLCTGGNECCNASCGICAPPGGRCTNSLRPSGSLRMSVACGPNTCNVGQVCCNASCGICTQPGDTCSQQRATARRRP